MSPQNKEAVKTYGVAIVTALITGAVMWGANNQRITYLENELRDVRPILLRIDLTLSRIEQSGKDADRRLTRLESGK